MAPWMIRPTQAALACVFAVLTAGCVTEARLAQDFRDERDDCVGRVFMDRSSWWCGWSDAIARRRTGPNTDEYEIARADMGRCRWIYVVERDTRRVTGWRYAGGEQDCYNRIDWLGPW